jgi:hypothetical protein
MTSPDHQLQEQHDVSHMSQIQILLSFVIGHEMCHGISISNRLVTNFNIVRWGGLGQKVVLRVSADIFAVG